jgi:hypothetical protein
VEAVKLELELLSGRNKMIEGGCFCKNIRYTVENGDYRIANCHCRMCQQTSGAPFVTWLVVPKKAFAYVSGKPRQLQSSSTGTRDFCSDCGTPLAFFNTERPDFLDLTCGSLDNPDDFVPTGAVHEESKLKWLKETE